MALFACVGRLGKDPEWNGEVGKEGRCKFTLAEDKKQEESTPNWWDCTVFGQQAEFCGQYLHKGRLVYITGTIEQRKSGEKTYHNVKVQEVKPLDRPRETTHEAPKNDSAYDPFSDE